MTKVEYKLLRKTYDFTFGWQVVKLPTLIGKDQDNELNYCDANENLAQTFNLTSDRLSKLCDDGRVWLSFGVIGMAMAFFAILEKNCCRVQSRRWLQFGGFCSFWLSELFALVSFVSFAISTTVWLAAAQDAIDCDNYDN